MAGQPSTPRGDRGPLLRVDDLRTRFRTEDGEVRAVDGVSFDVAAGETVAIVGESGSGKTVTGESITRLIRTPPGEVDAEAVEFKGRDLSSLSDAQLRSVRGGEIAHVFQNPGDALNPVYSVGWQIVEAIEIHSDRDGQAARERALELLDRVGIPEATARFDDYPHEFSGGMKQRVMLAMALAGEPDLLIADEPTTALDVTIQAQILRLLAEIQREFETAVLLITHDLGVVAQTADRVVVLYAGKVMERGRVYELFERPSHPYTRALLQCLPGRGGSIEGIGGALPDPTDPPAGCRYSPRCSHAVPACRTGEQPPLHERTADQAVSCVHFSPGGDPSVVLEDGSSGDDGVASGDAPAADRSAMRSDRDGVNPGGDRR